MSAESRPLPVNPETESPASEAPGPPGHARAAEARPGRTPARPKTAHRGPHVNAIQPTRPRPRERREPLEPAGGNDGSPPTFSTNRPTSPPSEPPPGQAESADSDSWTVPESVRDRFVRDGNRYYSPDGSPAFRDLGRRLTTASENTQVVHGLIQIAHSRGWTDITVSGTERFRQEAWRQARLAGLGVRGYRPTEPEQAALIRTIAGNLTRPAPERLDATPAEASAPEPRAPSGAPPPTDPPRERIVGRLLDHGRDAYRHDPNEEMSYFVRVETRDGQREIWGKDLERVVTKSLTQPQLGDEVILQKIGRDVVTVKRAERDDQGRLLGERDVETHRNRWVIEKSSFFDERAAAAQVVRDPTIEARTAVRDHPELTGTYLSLRAGELAAQQYLQDAEDRRRFVALLRAALAAEVERGEPLQPVRLRERAPSPPLKERVGRTAESELVR